MAVVNRTARFAEKFKSRHRRSDRNVGVDFDLAEPTAFVGEAAPTGAIDLPPCFECAQPEAQT